MHELASLIQRRKGDSSYDDLARRTGGELSRQYLARLGQGAEPLREVPKPETMFALAKALGVSVDLVAIASLRSAGVPVRGLDSAPLSHVFDILTDRQRTALAAVAEAMAYPHGGPADKPAGDVGDLVASVEGGQMIEAARRRERLTVRDVAPDAKVSVKDWRRIVAGEQAADADTWTDLAVAAGADYEDVLATVGLPVPGQEDHQTLTKGHDAAV